MREKHEGFPIPVGALADHSVVDDVLDHRDAAPFLALADVREVNLDDRHGEELERVPDRVAVVRPGAGVDDHAVGPAPRLVAGVDELALVVRLEAAHRAAELLRPLVDPGLELGVGHAAVERRIALGERVQIDPVQHQDLHRPSLLPDQRVRGLRVRRRREHGRDDRLSGRLEEDEDALALLVALERGPRRVRVGGDRLGPQDLLDDGRVEAGEAQRREETERDGLAVRDGVAGARLERVRERVPEVEDRASPSRSNGSERTTPALYAAQARIISSSGSSRPLARRGGRS